MDETTAAAQAFDLWEQIERDLTLDGHLKKLLLLARRRFVQARAALLNVDARDSAEIMKQQNEARFFTELARFILTSRDDAQTHYENLPHEERRALDHYLHSTKTLVNDA
jgi:hypothetical protein